MKAFLIDPDFENIRVVEYNGDWKTIKQWLGGPPTKWFTSVRLNDEGDAIYVDDEGLLNNNPHGWFMLHNYVQPLKGFGLVVGTGDRGETVEPFVSLPQLWSLITFPTHVNEALIDRHQRIRSL
jgi:hypothetical protein